MLKITQDEFDYMFMYDTMPMVLVKIKGSRKLDLSKHIAWRVLEEDEMKYNGERMRRGTQPWQIVQAKILAKLREEFKHREEKINFMFNNAAIQRIMRREVVGPRVHYSAYVERQNRRAEKQRNLKLWFTRKGA